ncbi:MAG: ribosomal protein S18-alanine N-acetyltransferase [Candidatus Nanopelagicaceae bacterium]
MITYRNLTLVDAVEIYELEKVIFTKEAWSLAQVKEELGGARRLYIGAVSGEAEGKEQIVGYGGIALGDESADIHTIAVVEEFRRQGIAKRLMARLERWAKDQGAKKLLLEMRVGNDEAKPLYESLGYEEISRRKDYYSPGMDAIVMEKLIDQEAVK